MLYKQKEAKRNPKNYSADVKNKNPKETGVYQECVLNDIPLFHTVNNPSVDIGHDFLEGICSYELVEILF